MKVHRSAVAVALLASLAVLVSSPSIAGPASAASAQSALWTFVGIASYLYPEQFPKGL